MKACQLLGLLASVLITGCTALPTAGPSAAQVVDQEVVDNNRRFDIVAVDRRVLEVLLAQPKASFYERFRSYGKPPAPKIGAGDSLSVTIWEAAAGGLFGGATVEGVAVGSHSVTMPTQTVARDGTISIPYAGQIPAAGRLPVEVQGTIVARLADKAIEPQAMVTVMNSVTNTATVSGEVVHGARLPLSLNGERLLDLIAAAGGASAPIYDTYVKLSRGGTTVTIPMERLVSEPRENIYAWPGDVLTLIRVPQSFTALGATTTNAQVDFGTKHLTLIQALAKAGGLVDLRSDPEGVFLFRYEPPAVVRELGIANLGNGPDGSTPVVFRFNMRDANSYFLAERFPVVDKDIVFVANAPIDPVRKFFDLLNTLTGPVIGGVVASGH